MKTKPSDSIVSNRITKLEAYYDLEDIKTPNLSKADEVPEGFFTLREYSKALKLCESAVLRRFKVLMNGNMVEKRKFKIMLNNHIQFIPHYKILKYAKSKR